MVTGSVRIASSWLLLAHPPVFDGLSHPTHNLKGGSGMSSGSSERSDASEDCKYDDGFYQIMLKERGLRGLLTQVYGFASRYLGEGVVEDVVEEMFKDVMQGEKTTQGVESVGGGGAEEGQDDNRDDDRDRDERDGHGDDYGNDFSMLPPELWHEILFTWGGLTVGDVMSVGQTCSRLADIVFGDEYARDKVRSLLPLGTNLERKAYRPIRFGIEAGRVDPFAAAVGLVSDVEFVGGRGPPTHLVAALAAAVERWDYGDGHDVADWLRLLGRVKEIAKWENDVGRAVVRSDWGGADVCIVEEVGVCAGTVGDTVTLLSVWEELGETRVGLGDILFRALCHAGREEGGPTVALAKEWMRYSWIDPDKKSATGESPLWAAVVWGSPSVVRALLNCGRLRMAPRSDSPESDEDDGTSLQDAFGWACTKHGYTDVVQWFLATGAVDVNFPAHRSGSGISPFLRACGCGVLSTVKVLLETGLVDLGYRDAEGYTAFHTAATVETPHTAELLDLLWATATSTDGAPDPSTVVTSYGSTPLHTACHYGSVPGVEWLLGREDVDVEARNESGYTPLAVAMSDGHADVVLALLANGRVDGMTRTDDGQSILHLALRAFEPSSPSLPLILDAIRSKCEKSIVHAETTELVRPIHIACMQADPSALRGLLTRWTDINVNVQDKDDWTPFHYACSDWGSVDTLRVLLEDSKWSQQLQRMILNTWNEDGLTPLMMACERDDIAVVNALLNAGVDPTWRGSHFRTALYYGLSARVVDALLRTGAFDINESLPMSGETVLHVLVDRVNTEGGVEAVKRLLEEDGIDVNCVTRKGNTPLHMVLLRYLKLQRDSEDDDVSIQEEGRALILTLLNAGASVAVKNCRRKSPIKLATKLGVEEIVWDMLAVCPSGSARRLGLRYLERRYESRVEGLMLAVEIGAMSATKVRSFFSSFSLWRT